METSKSVSIRISFQKHNLIFLRFHHISDDIQKRGRRSTYSFNQTQSQCGIRAEQMLNLDQAILPKEFKFRETGRHLAKMIRLEKQVKFEFFLMKNRKINLSEFLRQNPYYYFLLEI